ncbi:hypothetical protein DCC39_04455 [Pueribacillus theae]|uniref:UPF0738 protein DCC39_04455 n=1 Tax=Pueribacillus theae TaxID=2171751 RepID=A0A2U1K673_9BACI|nr:hypothetical protein [Pueribacillus theae]PWA12694.1 hypothetical protein DCC39_04455 [Pueribacillus theae]
MAARYEAVQIRIEENRVIASVSPSMENIQSFSPSGQMLVDSENLAFLYILDSEEGYQYVSFRHDLWETLKEGINQDMHVFIENNNNMIELKDFYTELAYLIHNIKDNPNYGERMEKEVETNFF